MNEALRNPGSVTSACANVKKKLFEPPINVNVCLLIGQLLGKIEKNYESKGTNPKCCSVKYRRKITIEVNAGSQ